MTAEKLVYGGDALARVDGQALLVPFVLPGEQAEVEARRSKGDLLRGRSPHILQASAHRTRPSCDYFGTCGGCHYQHADYGYQVEQKAAILRESFRRLGGFEFDGEIKTISGEPWGYRNRIQLHFDRGRAGFRRSDSRELCEVDHCPISSPLLNDAIKVISSAAKRREWPSFLQTLELFTDEKGLQLNVVETNRPVAARFFTWCRELLPACVPGPLQYQAAGHAFRVSRGSFFQVNRFLIDALVNEVTHDIAGGSIVDLYAGVGLFSLPLAHRAGRIEAVERGTSAYRDLEANTAEWIDRVFPVKSPTEDYLKGLSEAPDYVIADPPRAGLGPEATQELLRIGPSHVILVSCDPATLARDLKTLRNGYEMNRVTLVDLFPQTFHFETVVHLSAKPETPVAS